MREKDTVEMHAHPASSLSFIDPYVINKNIVIVTSVILKSAKTSPAHGKMAACGYWV